MFEAQNGNVFDFRLHRVPFLLEPRYMDEDDDFTEPHNTRMVRKFGSMERFEQVKKSHGLIPRGREAGLDESVGFTQKQLDKRVQSCTINSHRLVLYVSQFGLDKSEKLYSVLNRKHFIEAGILNDKKLLLESLKETGLTEEELQLSIDFLKDESRGKQEVLQMYEKVQAMGIYSIPTLVVDRTYIVNGAARADEVLQVFNKLLKEQPTEKRTFDQQIR